jgi:hypothetical protein
MGQYSDRTAITQEGNLENDITRKVRFQVLTALSLKMTVSWDVALCSLVALMMQAVSISETSLNLPDYTMQHPTRQSTTPNMI